jgi:hypothetical protein
MLAEALQSPAKLEAAPDAIKSWARFFVYQEAVKIMRLATQEARKEALEAHPLCERLKPEIARLWPLRGQIIR